MNNSAIIAWLFNIVFFTISVRVQYLEVVFVKVEGAWVGANKHTAKKKKSKQQRNSRPFLRAKVHRSGPQEFSPT